MDDLDYKLYVLAELNYKKNNPGMNEEELYPEDWFLINNYKLKNEIIAEALEKNILIKDTSKYLDFIQNVN